jgi:hypothetical protein
MGETETEIAKMKSLIKAVQQESTDAGNEYKAKVDIIINSIDILVIVKSIEVIERVALEAKIINKSKLAPSIIHNNIDLAHKRLRALIKMLHRSIAKEVTSVIPKCYQHQK